MSQCGITLQTRILLPLCRGALGFGGMEDAPRLPQPPPAGLALLQEQVLIRKLSVWKWEISRDGDGCCGKGQLRDESVWK